MKKVEVEKLVSKAIIMTVIICCVMFGMWLIQQGYFNYNTVLTMPIIMIGLSVIFAIGAITCIVFGVTKSAKFYEYATWLAVLAIFSMLFKINYEIKALEFAVSGVNIKFFPLTLCMMAFAMVAYWGITIVKIVRD